MFKLGSALLGMGLFFFAAYSSSPSYKLNNYSIGPGASNGTSSSTYKLQGTVGEQANGSTSSANYSTKNGSIQTEQLNTPLAPTLSNGSNTYYNMLNCIINTGINPSDSTYAIAVSTDNFVTTKYVQAAGTLGSSQVYQTYTSWGGAGGVSIIGLLPSTAYKVKVASMQGLYTNTAFGAVASASTVNTTITFSVSPNSSNIGSFLPSAIATSSNLNFTYVTNAASGGYVYVAGQNNGFYSTTTGHTIPAYTGNLASTSEGFGMQATNPSQTSGGPLVSVSPFNGTVNTVGAETTSFQPIFSTIAAIAGGTANANVQAKASPTTPAASDYNEVFTFIASANF